MRKQRIVARKPIAVSCRAVFGRCAGLFLDVGNIGSCEGMKIVDVSSRGARWVFMGKNMQDEVRGAARLRRADALADEDLRLYREGAWEDRGRAFSHQVIKACLHVLTQILAWEEPGILVN